MTTYENDLLVSLDNLQKAAALTAAQREFFTKGLNYLADKLNGVTPAEEKKEE